MTEGLVIVDKPAGPSSHDVVARLRRLAGTRRVGHAGTLDPMATGVLVIGVGRATRLLGHLSRHDKDYLATVRLGVSTTTDDAQGEPIETMDAGGVGDDALATAMAALTGAIEQIPSSVSAIKVDGRRAYAMVRAGEVVELAARPVEVSRFALLERRGDDLDVAVTCSTGTYVRALARDLGAALGVGGHLCALQRTRVGSVDLSAAHTLDELAAELTVTPLAAAAAAAFPRVDLDAEHARRLGLGQKLALELPAAGPVAAFGPDGELVALVTERDGTARVLAGFSAP